MSAVGEMDAAMSPWSRGVLNTPEDYSVSSDASLLLICKDIQRRRVAMPEFEDEVQVAM
jgi:hypothetical protein